MAQEDNTEYTIKTLDLLFCRISPETLVNRLVGESAESPTWNQCLRELFERSAETVFHGYSANEKALFRERVEESRKRYHIEKENPPFHLLVDYGAETLHGNGASPLCRYERVLSWRNAYLRLGQDTVTTAWLAYESLFHEKYVGSFVWPPVIHTDNRILEGIYNEGLHENHYHLYGSAETFMITWCSMMNYPELLNEPPNWFDRRLQAVSSRGSEENVWDMKRYACYAAFLRTLLYRALRGAEETEIMREFREFHRIYSDNPLSESQRELRYAAELMRILYPAPQPQPDGTEFVLDYALEGVSKSDQKADYRILAGERAFLFSCFRRCFNGAAETNLRPFHIKTQYLFYLYLLLKIAFRAELIQKNQEVGFGNFSDYEKRKYKIWQDIPAYWNEAYRTALNGPLNEGQVQSIEFRLSPKKTGKEDRGLIFRIDRAKAFFDADDPERFFITNGETREFEDKQTFAVWHFPKDADKAQTGLPAYIQCRHFQKRAEYRNNAIALHDALLQDSYLRDRTRGIDACSNEIVCRPEVFGQVFRYLRQAATPMNFDEGIERQPHIGITYHVGEDFLEISDGLRAIDEAIYFLGLERGDRLGHALALGVDPAIHYQTKSRQLILSKQDCLDNLTWLYYRSSELNVSMSQSLRSRIYAKAMDLLNDVYASTKKTIPTLSLRHYYLSWLLRGDAPECYLFETGSELVRIDPLEPFSRYALNRSPLLKELDSYRRNAEIVQLYHEYHYNPSVKNKGNETTPISVENEYIAMITAMQRAMQEYVDGLGLSVECNPSSNVLIGSFASYRNHPVFRFNSEGLKGSGEDIQMHISVNTDDQGVFDTSLPFEYSLIAATLYQETDESGKRVHTDREIERYIQNLRRMSREQTFSNR